MEQELLTEEEFMSQLRQQGVDSLEKVKKAYMEALVLLLKLTGNWY